jgi:hypothetical protein
VAVVYVEVLDSVQFRLLDTGKGGERARCGCCIEEKLCTVQMKGKAEARGRHCRRGLENGS